MKPKADLTHQTFDQIKPHAYGSIREKKVNPDLAEERALIDFDQKELTRLIYGGMYERHVEFKDMVEKHPIMKAGMEFYEMTREEQMERSMKVLNYIVKNPELISLHQTKSVNTLWLDYQVGQYPFAISLSMFIMTIQNLGNEQ